MAEIIELLQATIREQGLVLCSPIEIPRSEEPPAELRIAPPGTFKGHPTGPLIIDQAMAETVERNRAELGFRPPIDERHQTAVPLLSAPRFGSVGRYEWRPDGLWACDLAWNKRGKAALAGDDYGYVSLGLVRALKHPRTNQDMGPVMTHLSLVNVPFFGGAVAVAEHTGEDEMDLKELIAKVRADAVLKAELAEALGVTTAPAAPLTAEGSAGALDARLCEALGLSAAAKVEEALAALGKARKDRAAAVVAAGVAAGKVPKDPQSAMHQSLLVLAEGNPTAAEQVIAGMASPVPPLAPSAPTTQGAAAAAGAAGSAEMSEVDKQVCAELGLTDEDWKKHQNGR